jgi:hypothetical protein
VSLTGPDFFQPELGAVMTTAVGRKCFVCEKPIKRDPAWTWAGATGQIWAHLGCVADLCVRALSDVHLWQRQSGRRFHELDGR